MYTFGRKYGVQGHRRYKSRGFLGEDGPEGGSDGPPSICTAYCFRGRMTRGAASRGGRERCAWAETDPLLVEYHDEEWGVPVHEDRKLFEFLVLDGAQAGLSWLTVLRKRENYRKAFGGFDPERVARFGPRDVKRLLGDERIIRNRLKIEAAIRNARSFLQIQQEFGSFDRFVWGLVGDRVRKNRWRRMGQIPAKSEASDWMSVDLRDRGFSFVGSTICYAFMQAAGMVNDHVVSCFRYERV